MKKGSHSQPKKVQGGEMFPNRLVSLATDFLWTKQGFDQLILLRE